MAYNYYCVNCGNRFKGEEIKFDLFELIGLRKTDKAESKAIQASLIIPGVLKGNAQQCKVKLEHGKRVPLTISLKTLFTILSVNGDEMTKQALSQSKYDDNDLRAVFELLLRTNENKEVEQEKISEYVNQVRQRFLLEKGKEEGSKDPADYKCTFYVKPEFFENGKSEHIYTLEYALDKNAPNTTKIKAPQPIRGYCPACGEPILLNAGKYPHVLVGFLGAQSAGKTTMILSLLQELMMNFTEHGIYAPSIPLCDSRYNITRRNQKIFNNGWLPVKTVESGVNSFNASFLLESKVSNKKILVTFADIAGEKCYDPETDAIDTDALQVFPLINSCDVYILCTCLDKTQYVKSDNEKENKGDSPEEENNDSQSEKKRIDMPPQAVLRIVDGIYKNLRDFRIAEYKTPPLCIVMTKTDMVSNATAQPISRNPFDAITPSPQYSFRRQFQDLSMTYKTFGEEKIREPLEWCCKAFEMMNRKTYTSMMACSATGRVGDIWTEDKAEPSLNENKRFKSKNIDVLADWLLKVIGVTAVSGNYCFGGVPSYNEHYLPARSGEEYKNDHFTDVGAAKRCEAVSHVFLNPSPEDGKVLKKSKETKEHPASGGGIWSNKNRNANNNAMKESLKDLKLLMQSNEED